MPCGAWSRPAPRGPDAGAVTPRLVGADGHDEHSVQPFPTVAVTLAYNLRLHRLSPGLADRLCLEDRWDRTRPREVPWSFAAFLALRRRAFDSVGGFDPAPVAARRGPRPGVADARGAAGPRSTSRPRWCATPAASPPARPSTTWSAATPRPATHGWPAAAGWPWPAPSRRLNVAGSSARWLGLVLRRAGAPTPSTTGAGPASTRWASARASGCSGATELRSASRSGEVGAVGLRRSPTPPGSRARAPGGRTGRRCARPGGRPAAPTGATKGASRSPAAARRRLGGGVGEQPVEPGLELGMQAGERALGHRHPRRAALPELEGHLAQVVHHRAAVVTARAARAGWRGRPSRGPRSRRAGAPRRSRPPARRRRA